MTRVAFADRNLRDVALPPPECEIGALDDILQMEAVDFGGDEIDESGVTLELGKLKRRAQRADDGVYEVGKNVLRVIELNAGQIARVAGNIGDQQARRFWLR